MNFLECLITVDVATTTFATTAITTTATTSTTTSDNSNELMEYSHYFDS